MARYLYARTLSDFVAADALAVLGEMGDNYHGDLLTTTHQAWRGEIDVMQQVLKHWAKEQGMVVFEYDIPRLGKRIDVVVLLRGMVFCLEFKVGRHEVLQADVEQVLDYALDLKNFHLLSAERQIVPILIPTEYEGRTEDLMFSVYDDSIYNPICCGADALQATMADVLNHAGALPDVVDWGKNWLKSPYSPTPTIIEAARKLYEDHSVEDITRHEADVASTDATIRFVMDVIRRSKERGEKSICFVTGVPGAGKTLVGLDVAVKQTYQGGNVQVADEGAVYLSGNGPLVAVLTEALAIDNQKKIRQRGERKNLSDARREVRKFIQIIHRYRDNMLAKIKNPVENGVLEIDPEKAISLKDSGYAEVEHVAIFDEAQRAWTHKRLADYLRRGGTYGNKLKVPNFPMSEPAFLIWSLDQRLDWATIVCLVGGGQEINTGEAGIAEWLRALGEHFPHWRVYISNRLTEKEYAEGRVEEMLKKLGKRVKDSPCLHLAVSKRSFRAEKLSEFIHALLSFEPDAAKIYAEIKERYPIRLTRDMSKARAWIRQQARGTQRTGILVTKEAARFKPLAVDILAQGDKNAVHWFLEDKADVRSSNYLEDAATEIQVQGLELDYACVLWDADMRQDNGRWRYYHFNGKNAWQERNPKTQKEQTTYMLNAYRVLLTRARIGMVICVPAGNARLTPAGFWEDATRLPEFYDGTYEYLQSLGIPVLD